MILQQTLGASFQLAGVGIHTGRSARVTVHPAEEGSGRYFLVDGITIPARVEYVVDTARKTTLGTGSARVSTVEHILSALHGCGVDNARIEVTGPEMPILDGSALPFVDAILAVGIRQQEAPARLVSLRAPVEVEERGSLLSAMAADGFHLEVTTEFDDWPEGNATVEVAFGPGLPESYAGAVAPARTFAFRKEVEMLLAAGLAQGGSLENALIITPPAGFSAALRLPREWAVHKMLDVIGDLALLDARLNMRVTAVRPGHPINTRFAGQIVKQLNSGEEASAPRLGQGVK